MLYLSIFLLNVLDLITTHIGVNILGFYELNPVMRPLISSWVIVPIKLTGAFLVSYGLYRINKIFPHWKPQRAAAWGVFFLYLFVVISNTLAILGA